MTQALPISRLTRIKLPPHFAFHDPVALAQATALSSQALRPKALFQRFELATRKLSRSIVPLVMKKLEGPSAVSVIRDAMPAGSDEALPLLIFTGVEALTGADSVQTPDLLAYRLELYIEIDHAKETAWLISDASCPEITPGSVAHAQLLLKLDGISILPAAANSSAKTNVATWEQDVDFAGHAQRVNAIRAETAGGELYGVNLSIGLSRPTSANPFVVYQACVAANPSPYGYVLQDGNFALVGSSPLAFLQLTAGNLHLETDAGTRPVTGDANLDNAAEIALRHSEKDAVEHQIVVNAETHALRPIARSGHVETVVSRQVRRFSHVMHLYSAFEAPLADGLDVTDALVALAPAAAVSGFPKLAALRFARQLEQTERGPYGGVIGIVRSRMDADFAVVIRSLWIQGGVATLRVGGKVVADSDARSEYDEALSKSRFLVNALARAESAHSHQLNGMRS